MTNPDQYSGSTGVTVDQLRTTRYREALLKIIELYKSELKEERVLHPDRVGPFSRDELRKVLTWCINNGIDYESYQPTDTP
jgi:hypothetical protein